MGEVYRARDTKLNRDVAIKVLLPSVANDPDRLARFSREAQVLASLNHPNIAHIHGLEESGGVTALVMELVEGEDLSQRISRGPIPLDEALPIARQIAEALEAAHDHGIIHRDLKPANIKVRPDGTVKVLDFGLAKAVDPSAGSSASAMNSPTLSIHATEAGLILGTAAYMSPEQAAGKSVDKRSDLWAFGVVLMEMLTGRQVFKGETVSHVIAAVLKDEPDWAALPSGTPASIHRLLHRCLEKDLKKRLRDATVARIEIDDAGNRQEPPSPTRRTAQLWATALALAVGMITAGTAVWLVTRNAVTSVPANVVRFAVHDNDQVIVSRVQGDMALSPDGRSLAFVGFGTDGPRIWVRDLNAAGVRPLQGTEGGASVAWSPDGRSLAFNAYGPIKKIAIVGGVPVPEMVGSASVGGGAGRTLLWLPGDTVFFNDSRGFWRVAPDRTAELLVRSADETHQASDALPDGRLLMSVQSKDPATTGTYVSTLDRSVRSRVLPFATWTQYVAGYLLFARDRNLYAQPFEPSTLKLSGTPVVLAESAASVFSASKTGSLAYLPLDASERPNAAELVWMDRRGQILERIDQAAGATVPTLSPDGRRLAISLRSDIWVFDLGRSVLSKAVQGGVSPTWSAGGERLMFHRSGLKDGKDVIFEAQPGDAREKMVVEPANSGGHAHPTDISHDGGFLAFEGTDAYDVWVKPLKGDGAPRAFTSGPTLDTQPAFSPDGRWISYTSNVSGAFEVYVQRFPEGGARIQVSSSGGSASRWRRDGKELFYVAANGTLMAAAVRSGAAIEFDRPQPLFRFFSTQRGIPTQKPPYDVTPDGRRFIVSAVPRRNDPSIQVVITWPAWMTSKATQ
jgi:Tol biopolymer transport system component